MTEFIYRYIDLVALALTFIFPLIVTVRLKKRAGARLRSLPAYLLVFGPCGTIAFIFFHLFENTYRAVLGLLNGSFHYTFHFYALMLVGVVVAYLGFQFLAACQHKCFDTGKADRNYFIQLSLLLVFTVPQIPLISIAAVPFYCCVISLLGFGFVHRKTNRLPATTTDSSFVLSA
ncbi:MAG TPA: hypothetical protein VFT06_07190 [Flavisolibacter sp.]|nr:hypothetical protein [Flavisolibacter sp.]